MATENPTDDGRAVRLIVPVGNMPFLRRTLGAVLEGAQDDVKLCIAKEEEPPAKLLREEKAYAALLDALDLGSAVPDEELRDALRRLLTSVDKDNDYERARSEHDALDALLQQLTRRAA